MRSIVRSTLVLALLASTPPAASAQLGLAHHFVTVGVGGGVSVPVNDAAAAFKNGFNLQGFARLNVPHLPVIPRFDLDFSRFDLDQAQVGLPGRGQILAALANLQFSVLSLGPVRPYLLAGLGAYNVTTETDGTTGATIRKTNFGINGGAGVALHLGAFNGYAEGRVDNVFTQAGMIDATKIQVVPVTFGITF